MEVDDLLDDLQKGEDAQLDIAMKVFMDKVKAHPLTLPPVLPKLAAYPALGRD